MDEIIYMSLLAVILIGGWFVAALSAVYTLHEFNKYIVKFIHNKK